MYCRIYHNIQITELYLTVRLVVEPDQHIPPLSLQFLFIVILLEQLLHGCLKIVLSDGTVQHSGKQVITQLLSYRTFDPRPGCKCLCQICTQARHELRKLPLLQSLQICHTPHIFQICLREALFFQRFLQSLYRIACIL